MIARLLAGSARRRWRHWSLIALAVAATAATVAATAGLGSRLEGGLSAALHAAGPNLVVRPQVGGPERLPAAEVARVAELAGVEAAVGIAETPAAARWIATGGGARVERTASGAGTLPVVAATGSLAALHPDWELDGRWPAAGEALLGAALVPPAELPRAGGVDTALAPSGRLTTGEAIDSSVVVVLSPGAGAGVDRIEVRAAPSALEVVARSIEATVPGAEARPLARVTATDARLAGDARALLLGAGLVVHLLALITIGSAALALLDDRRRELALLLSLGYTGRWVQGLLSAELAVVALVAMLGGALAGDAAAASLAERLLGPAVAGGSAGSSIAALAAGALAVLLLTVAAAALVRHRIERLDAALVLQGR